MFIIILVYKYLFGILSKDKALLNNVTHTHTLTSCMLLHHFLSAKTASFEHCHVHWLFACVVLWFVDQKLACVLPITCSELWLAKFRWAPKKVADARWLSNSTGVVAVWNLKPVWIMTCECWLCAVKTPLRVRVSTPTRRQRSVDSCLPTRSGLALPRQRDRGWGSTSTTKLSFGKGLLR